MLTTTKKIAKALPTLLYRGVKSCVRSLPPWLIRFRPFGIYEICLLQEKDLPPRSTPKPPRQIRWVGSREEAHNLKEIADTTNIADWNSSTRRAAAVWIDDKAIAVAWIARDTFCEPELGLCYKLTPDEAWLFAAVVLPEFRRQGVYSELLEFVVNELGKEGLGRILCGVTSGNRPSQNAHLNANARKIGHVFAARILGLNYCQTGGLVKQLRPHRFPRLCTIELSVE